MNTSDHASSPARQFAKVCEILDRNERKPSRLIPILQAVQEEYRYLPEEVLTYIATSLRVPPSKVFGVATFYSHFALAPKGKYVVRLCDGTACHVKGSISILDAMRGALGLEEGKSTSPDLLFTVETVACLGACGLAPVMVINDEVHGQVAPQSAKKTVEDILAQEASR
ncbi:MAG: NAD(P)H-dependent oxidoreductase subunit E [Myxococcales bacterium]|jgi:NADH-quinone oxidoreductase subunit E